LVVLPTAIEAVWISALLVGAGLPPVPEPVVPPHAASSKAASPPTVSPIESRIDLMSASSGNDPKTEYDRWLRSALAKPGCPLYDAGHMTGRVRFAGFYFYAYLGPARDRLGMG
jgi:hypothetical protein